MSKNTSISPDAKVSEGRITLKSPYPYSAHIHGKNLFSVSSILIQQEGSFHSILWLSTGTLRVLSQLTFQHLVSDEHISKNAF